MSNEVNLEPTEFKDLRTGAISKGFRMYDSYASTYNNSMELVPDDDLEFLKMVVEDYSDDIVLEMLEYIRDNQEELHIGDRAYSYAEIKDIIK